MKPGKYERGLTPEQRFWAKVDRFGDDECWGWKASRNQENYGLFLLGRKKITGSRASWFFHFGDPGKLHVLHKCDNPPCCNPKHLFLGTHADNMRDMVDKGRNHSEERMQSIQAAARLRKKLTNKQEANIRMLHRAGASLRGLALMFGVDRNVIVKAVRANDTIP